LVIGTMCDPYQPAEIKHRLTRASLKLIAASDTRMKKVGIFTRSPLIVQDAELIASLPRARVHFTVSPFDEKTRKIVEPYPISAKARFRAIEKLQKAGIRVHVNVAPALPIVSDRLIEPYAKILATMKVNEFFVDPMQPYSDSFDAMREAMGGSEEWAAIEDIVLNKRNYRIWKQEFHRKWTEAWKKVRDRSPNTMPISSDHASKKKIDMNTGEYLDWESYDQYEGK
jgi:DNA repair photolyase